MGCDIHLHIEVKIRGQWQHYSHPYISTGYGLFAKMAGVRNSKNITPISEPKGAVPDMTPVTAYNLAEWNGDAHSLSWLDKDEVAELVGWFETDYMPDAIGFEHNCTHCYLFGNSFSGPSKNPKGLIEGLEDVRFVFWFDN